MKSDLSKSTFDPKKRYTSVRMQQRQVQLDSDWNGQVDIVSHRVEFSNADVFGGRGAPKIVKAFSDHITIQEKLVFDHF